MLVNELDKRLESCRENRKKALIGYLSAGYPKFNKQIELIKAMEKNGVDILELGIPFSDPIADGPTIQFASQEALKNGVTLSGILNFVKKLKKHVSLPIVFMSYVNPIDQYGWNRFSREASRCGVSGLILPDMVPEEAGKIKHILKKNNIRLIFLVAPTTPKKRLQWIGKSTSGFLYAVSVTGVTGARKTYRPDIKKWLDLLRKGSRVPVCLGFGISNPKHIKKFKSRVDGFIVGSALIDIIRKNSASTQKLKLSKFVRSLSKECHYAS